MQRTTIDRTEQLVRQFGVLGLWVLVVNGILGAGIFGLPAKVAAATGEFSALLFVACGVLIAPIVLSFAEAASYVRTTGGPVVYVGTVFGSFASFQTGWAMYASRATAFAANVNLLADSLGWLWPRASSGGARVAIVAGVCAVLTFVNVIGSKQAMRTAGVLTVLKLAPIGLLVVAGLVLLSPQWLPHADAPLPSVESAGAAVLLAMYAFVGWEVALEMGMHQLAHALMDRAVNGVEVQRYYHGELVSTERRYDNRLAQWVLENPWRMGRAQLSREYTGMAFDNLLERIEADSLHWVEGEPLPGPGWPALDDKEGQKAEQTFVKTSWYAHDMGEKVRR